MVQASIEVAKNFWGNLEQSQEAQTELRKYDRQIQFELVDDESFFVDIKGGKVSINKGKAKTSTEQGPIYFVTDKETLLGLFRGKLRFTTLYAYAPGTTSGKGKLYAKPSPGVATGMIGGVLIYWVGKLIRMGQEFR